MKRVTIPIATITDGSCTAYGDSCVGALYAVQLEDGDLADGVDITLTAENGQGSIPLLAQLNFNTDQMQYPRVLQTLNTDGTALATHCEPVVFGRLKLVVAQGGAVKTGSVTCFIREI